MSQEDSFGARPQGKASRASDPSVPTLLLATHSDHWFPPRPQGLFLEWKFLARDIHSHILRAPEHLSGMMVLALPLSPHHPTIP